MIDSTLCYLYRGDEVLMMHRTRKKNDMNHDKWIAIGGRFEDKESPEDCALREVREETGLTMTSWRYRGLVTFVNDLYETERMHLFTSEEFEGELTDCEDPLFLSETCIQRGETAFRGAERKTESVQITQARLI